MREGVLRYNTARDVRAPKMTQLIERPDGFGPLFDRNRAIMELFYSSGLRLAELVGLNLADLDLSDRTVRVLGKGSRERIVPVGRMAATALRHYLAERKRRAKPGESALFLGRRGERLGPREVQFRVALWARKAGISRHVTPHMFRHSCATHLLESSSGIREVQEFLGHASISTTAIYTHLNFQHLATAHFAAHPRAEQVARAESATDGPIETTARQGHDITSRSIHERRHTTNETLA
jgi:integrase/recombinase XerC